MKTERNFKIRFHNIVLPTTTYLISAKDHAEAFRRFSGIIRNKGFYESRAHWRGYHTDLKVNDLRSYSIRFKRPTRTYYFMPFTHPYAHRVPYDVRFGLEVAMEVTKLK